MSDHSLVFLFSGLERHTCGYCKSATGNISHGMWAKSLTVEDYQNLIDRGWRRSGNYCYKPLMKEICCPMYTIKCDTLKFQLSKSQKKVIKKFNKFLKDGVLQKTNSIEFSDNISAFVYKEAPKKVSETAISDSTQSSSSNDCSKITEACNEKPQCSKQIKNGVGADPTKPPCKKAKILRMERRKEKLLKRGMSLEKLEAKSEQKSLEEFLNQVPTDGAHKLKLEVIHTASSEWEKLKKVEYNLYKKYQMIVHNDPPEKCKMEGFIRFLVNSPLQITLERLHEKHKFFKLTAQLFTKYQIAVHGESPEECNETQYLNFLIDSPLQHIRFSKDSDLGFGSFHQLYWLDDKLIAVGVIDILPKCVSAVYFFYDPDYRDLTLGTYGSLREVEFARSLYQTMPSIQNYYMGFYIHSCAKMRYKGKLTPSFLLCPETYQWVAIERCLPKIEASKYSRLVDDCEKKDENCCNENDLNEMKILVNRKLMLYQNFKRKYGPLAIFEVFSELVGRKCAKSLIFVDDE